MELYITIGIIIFGIILFVKDSFSIDTTSMLIMVLFIITGVLSPDEGFAGFIHPATITLGCMFVISSAIFKSGIIDGLSTRIIKLAKIHYSYALLTFCFVTAFFSAFVNDSAVVAIMIPMALVVCKETGIEPSRLLIPISFSACFGGACTLIGTGANILISSYAEQNGLDGFGMFEFSKAALVLVGLGSVYLFVIAPILLPRRNDTSEGDSLLIQAESYTAEIVLLGGKTEVNKKYQYSRLCNEFNAHVLSVVRNFERYYDITDEFVLHENDVLKIQISPKNLLDLKVSGLYKIKGDHTLKDFSQLKENVSADSENSQENIKRIYEILIPSGSGLANKSLKQLNFRKMFNSSVLAVRHRDETLLSKIKNVQLKEGDMLLLLASEKDLQKLTSQGLAFALSHYEKKQMNIRKAIFALVIAVAVIGAATLNFTSILMSGMIGCMLLVTTSTLKPQEAYQAIDWKVIFMMAGVLSMGMALDKTGGSDSISIFIFEYLGSLDPRITLSLIFLTTFLSTNIISSKATAALMAPIVISLSAILGVSERPFLVAVMFACAFTFMTPVSNPTNTMVYAPGGYKYNDYLKVGTPLNLIIWVAASFVIPYFFPF